MLAGGQPYFNINLLPGSKSMGPEFAFINLSDRQRLTKGPRKAQMFPEVLSMLQLSVRTMQHIWGKGGGQHSPGNVQLSEL